MLCSARLCRQLRVGAASAQRRGVAQRRVFGSAGPRRGDGGTVVKLVAGGVSLGCGSAALVLGTGVGEVTSCEAAPPAEAPALEQPLTPLEEYDASRSKTWQAVWKEIIEHWLSFGALTLATFVSTLVDRVMLAGQVQQLMQLPGQMPLEQLLSQIGVVFGIKAVHLIAEAIKAVMATRLGEKVERKVRGRFTKVVKTRSALVAEGEVPGRSVEATTLKSVTSDELRGGCREASSAMRVLVVEAAPKVVTELIYGTMSGVGALYTSWPLTTYFFAHEGLMGQLVQLGAGALAARRDGYGAEAETAREEWERAVFANDDQVAQQIIRQDQTETDNAVEAKSKVMQGACVAFGDAQAVVERSYDASQLAVLSSFVVSAAALVDRNVLGADGTKYAKVMGFSSNAMMAAGETAQNFEKFARASETLMPLYRFEKIKIDDRKDY